jgi:hypothetical protein
MNLEINATAQKDIEYLLEAYDYGQFADDMFDHPSPSCRSPCKPLREVLRRHLDWLQSQIKVPKDSIQHVCGLQGFGALGDTCPACEKWWSTKSEN